MVKWKSGVRGYRSKKDRGCKGGGVTKFCNCVPTARSVNTPPPAPSPVSLVLTGSSVIAVLSVAAPLWLTLAQHWG